MYIYIYKHSIHRVKKTKYACICKHIPIYIYIYNLFKICFRVEPACLRK